MSFLNKLRIEVQASECVEIDNQWNCMTPHVSSFNRFYYILKGKVDIRVGGESLTLRKGNAYILPAGALLQLRPPNRGFKQLYIHFNATLPGGGDFFAFFKCPFELPCEIYDDILPREWLKLFSGATENQTLNELNAEAVLRLLINPFIVEGLKNSPDKQHALFRFEKIISYVEGNSHKQIKNAVLAKIMSLQPTYFSNLFAKHFGMPPRRYISQVRVNKAQVLLEHTLTPVKNIAETVGYDDELYFSRIFKQHVGLSPTAYRRQRQVTPY